MNNSTSEPVLDTTPYFTCNVYRLVTYVGIHSLLYLISIFGNSISFVAWNKIGKTKGYNSSIALLQGLAVVDCLHEIPILFAITLPELYRATGYIEYYYFYLFPYLYKYTWPFASMGNLMTIWFTTLITIHRYLILSHPFHSITLTITSSKSTTIQMACVAVFGVLYNIPRFFETDIINYQLTDGRIIPIAFFSKLHYNPNYNLYYMTVSYLVLVNLGPLLTCVVLTIKIIQLLAKARASRRNMTSATAASANQDQHSSITVTLLAVIIIFILCQIPNTVYRMLITFRPDIHYLCGTNMFFYPAFASIFLSLNSSINIFIYLKSSQDFRKTVRGMFRCKSQEGVLAASHSISRSTSRIELSVISTNV